MESFCRGHYGKYMPWKSCERILEDVPSPSPSRMRWKPLRSQLIFHTDCWQGLTFVFNYTLIWSPSNRLRRAPIGRRPSLIRDSSAPLSLSAFGSVRLKSVLIDANPSSGYIVFGYFRPFSAIKVLIWRKT